MPKKTDPGNVTPQPRRVQRRRRGVAASVPLADGALGLGWSVRDHSVAAEEATTTVVTYRHPGSDVAVQGYMSMFLADNVTLDLFAAYLEMRARLPSGRFVKMPKWLPEAALSGPKTALVPNRGTNIFALCLMRYLIKHGFSEGGTRRLRRIRLAPILDPRSRAEMARDYRASAQATGRVPARAALASFARSCALVRAIETPLIQCGYRLVGTRLESPIALAAEAWPTLRRSLYLGKPRLVGVRMNGEFYSLRTQLNDLRRRGLDPAAGILPPFDLTLLIERIDAGR